MLGSGQIERGSRHRQPLTMEGIKLSRRRQGRDIGASELNIPSEQLRVGSFN
jgi:hypothetical protein